MKLSFDELLKLPTKDFEELLPFFALFSCQLADSKRKGEFTIPVTHTEKTLILHSGLKDWIMDKETGKFTEVIDPENIRNGKIQ